MKNKIKTFPVNLILTNKKCLIIGGGKVATRKVNKLLQVNADITVISPRQSDTLKSLEQRKKITCLERYFDESDLSGVHLVFIATNDTKLNEQVMLLCLQKNILCCAVDHNWQKGHFITPASVEKKGINIAISTNGSSCRRTRLIKDNIAKHIEMVECAELMIIGTDHNYLSLTEREALHLTGNKFEQIGNMLSHLWGIHDYMVINTCNRIEVVAIVSPDPQLENLLIQILGFTGLSNNSYYVKYGEKAFAHLPSILAGLMSQTPGEKHITNQFKTALKIAKEKNWAGSMIQEWMDSALHISKHIRTEVEPLLKNDKIEDLSIKYLKTECHSLKHKHVLVIGTGVIGETITKTLLEEGARLSWCYHKNKPVNTLPDNCSLINLDDFESVLPKVDIVVCATTSPTPLLHHGHAQLFDAGKQIFIIDLSNPRNVSPELAIAANNITLTNLDDLKHWFRREACDMTKISEISKRLINEHKALYHKILYHFQGEALV